MRLVHEIPKYQGGTVNRSDVPWEQIEERLAQGWIVALDRAEYGAKSAVGLRNTVVTHAKNHGLDWQIALRGESVYIAMQ